ncbi:hypothetical protein ACRWWY_20570, partial [Escherichia coli]
TVNDFMDSVHHIWCPLSSQEYQDLPDGAETTLTNNVGGFGDVEKASHVFVRNELIPLQKRLIELNEWLNDEIIRFDEYKLGNT